MSLPTMPPKVTVSMPIYGAHEYLPRAVNSLLSQTFKDFVVCIVSDGEAQRPWSKISNIKDHRVVTWNLNENRGPYFIHELVRRASTSEYLAIVDADDWVERSWLAKLLWAVTRDGSVGAVSRLHSNDWPRPLSSELTHDLFHQGVWKSDVIGSIGGYYGGERVSYDTYMLRQVRLVGSVSFVDEPIYHRTVHPASLTHRADTGLQSPMRLATRERLRARWAKAFQTVKRLKPNARAAALAELNSIPAADEAKLATESKRLSMQLRRK